MRAFLAFVFCLLAITSQSATIVCTNLVDSRGTNYSATVAKFTPISKIPQQYGSNTVMPSVITTAISDSSFSVGIVAGGVYWFDTLPPNSYVMSVKVLIPSNDTNTYNLNQVIALATNANVFLWTNQYPIVAGDGVYFTTNGSLISISVSPNTNAVTPSQLSIINSAITNVSVGSGLSYGISATRILSITNTYNTNLFALKTNGMFYSISGDNKIQLGTNAIVGDADFGRGWGIGTVLNGYEDGISYEPSGQGDYLYSRKPIKVLGYLDATTGVKSNGVYLATPLDVTNAAKSISLSATNDYNTIILARRYIQQNTTNIQFLNTSTNTPSHQEGLVYYDNATHTLAYYNDQPDVTVNIGQEQHVRVVNKTGLTITNGQTVTIIGAQGNRPQAVLAQSTTNTTSTGYSFIGVATHNITNNLEGLVTTYGVVNGIDTRGYTAGQALFVGTNAGTITTNVPDDSLSVMKVGIALNSTASGSILVVPQDAIHLNDVTGLTNQLTVTSNSLIAYVNNRTNFNSLHVTNNSIFESDVYANSIFASEFNSTQINPASPTIAQWDGGLLNNSAIAITNVATKLEVQAATNGLSGGGVTFGQVTNTVTGMGTITNNTPSASIGTIANGNYLSVSNSGVTIGSTNLSLKIGNSGTVLLKSIFTDPGDDLLFDMADSGNIRFTNGIIFADSNYGIYLGGETRTTWPSSGVSLTQVSNTVVGMGAITNGNVGAVTLKSDFTVNGTIISTNAHDSWKSKTIINGGIISGGNSGDTGGEITANGDGSIAFGLTSESGTIIANQNGAMALGTADQGGRIYAEFSAISLGYASGANSELSAEDGGAVVIGQANAGGKMKAVNPGSFVGGYASGTTNTATINGEFLWVGPVMSITNAGAKTAITPTSITINNSQVLTNAIIRVGTNGTLLPSGATSLVFQATSSTSVTGGISGKTITIGIPNQGGGGGSQSTNMAGLAITNGGVNTATISPEGYLTGFQYQNDDETYSDAYRFTSNHIFFDVPVTNAQEMFFSSFGATILHPSMNGKYAGNLVLSGIGNFTIAYSGSDYNELYLNEGGNFMEYGMGFGTNRTFLEVGENFGSVETSGRTSIHFGGQQNFWQVNLGLNSTLTNKISSGQNRQQQLVLYRSTTASRDSFLSGAVNIVVGNEQTISNKSDGAFISALTGTIKNNATNVFLWGGAITNGIPGAEAGTNNLFWLKFANGKEIRTDGTNFNFDIPNVTGLVTPSQLAGSNYVTASITNNGLVSLTQLQSSNYVTASVTNGLVSSAGLSSSNYVTQTVTNGLATQTYVTSQGYVTQTVTNNLVPWNSGGSNLFVAGRFGATVVTNPVITLTYSSGTNITVDFSLGNKFTLTLTNNAYFTSPINGSAMQDALIEVRQDSTGGRTCQFTNQWKFPGGQVLTFTTNASSMSLMSVMIGTTVTNANVVQTLNFQ